MKHEVLRPVWGIVLLGSALCAATAEVARAELWDAGALHAPTNFAGAPLTLDEAGRLALTEQPVLRGRAAAIAALDEQAVAAAQLPDPTLSTGLRDVPVNSRSAFSLRKDDFTEFTVGLTQDIPRAVKRRLRGAREQLQAAAQRYGLDDERRAVQRDAALAWLDAYAAEQGLLLTHALATESALQVQSLAKDYSTGGAAQAEWLTAKVAAGLANDTEHDWLHHAQRARAGLERWIGAQDARRPLAALPRALVLPGGSVALITLPELIALVDRHPVVRSVEKQTDVAMTDVALARQNYKPDLTIEGYFAYRQDFADFVGVQVSVDLPLFTRNRQDRALAAALHLADASQDQRNDLLRRLHAEVAQYYLDWRHYAVRAADFDTTILPTAQRRIDAATRSYAAGRGSFDALLSARRGVLDAQLQRLALAVESARAQVRLQYLVGQETAP